MVYNELIKNEAIKPSKNEKQILLLGCDMEMYNEIELLDFLNIY